MTAGVKSGKTQNEHMFSGLPAKADLTPLRQLLANAAIAASRVGS